MITLAMLGIYHDAQRGSPEVVCEVEEEDRESTKRKIKILHSDNGESIPFLQLCHDDGVETHFTLRETL